MADVVWLGEEWVKVSGDVLRAGVDPLERPPGELNGRVAIDVTGKAGGSYWRLWEAGSPVAGGTGKPVEPTDVTLTITDVDARQFWEGNWSPCVAFMRGRLKVAGDMGVLLALLALVAHIDTARAQRVLDSSME